MRVPEQIPPYPELLYEKMATTAGKSVVVLPFTMGGGGGSLANAGLLKPNKQEIRHRDQIFHAGIPHFDFNSRRTETMNKVAQDAPE